VGRLVVIEGLDGAGKRTLADRLEKALLDRDAAIGRIAFPRYGRSRAADLVRDALYERAGDLSTSVYGMAALYALDRHGAFDELTAALAEHDVVLLDRYVASNAAYGAARLGQDGGGAFVEWVRRLEVERHGMPVPDVQLLLRVPNEVAAGRARQRAVEEAGRGRDVFESDAELQARVAAVYDDLAARRWLAPWRVLAGATPVDCADLAGELLG
jgi:dTMP kinase